MKKTSDPSVEDEDGEPVDHDPNNLTKHQMWLVTRLQDSKKYADTTSFVVTAVTTNLVVTVLLL